MLLLQALPLVALVALLASGRVTAPAACAVALLLCLPAAFLALPAGGSLVAFSLRSVAEGVWLSIVPVGIILGGLVFHTAVSDGARAPPNSSARPVADTLFTAAFLLGPFAETVTGFGVGTVFAVGAIRGAGVTGALAATIGLIAQTLIPWGGLGPGTALGAALAGVPGQEIASRNAIQLAAELLLILPLFWHLCRRAGHPVALRSKAGQLAWVATLGASLVAWHRVAPWEMCGLLATGPVLAIRLLLSDPPRDAGDWRRAAEGAFPYVLLAAALLGSRLWRGAPSWQPVSDLPALPLNHPMVALWVVALLLLAGRGRSPRGIWARGRRPALALLMFVLLARFLSNASVPQALAGALVAALGGSAAYAAPLLAALSGFFAGTNVGSNSAMMPLQAALGRAAGLGEAVLPAVQNGTLALILSPQLTAVASGLAGDGATPAGIWRRGWPIVAIGVAVGLAAVAIG